MMGWNYRVMRHTSGNENSAETGEWFAIHEVYYRNDKVDDLTVDVKETSYTREPITVVVEADRIDELRLMLEQMLEAFEKPVLEYEND
jgi:hypothetical protein